ncbi:MAG: hypothetical protein EOO50_02980 [Flavobacterium sp.]|uniref:hypothetical protein n=1 Tax=Flavobacterium sp. TaxID=239 RepID=UPI00121811E3|nr:hypothetical protein [Flavobacterium sp.]RZJ68067.1 MAG: hypothetical protein EOO50_02980 [Flavobacterium sp.]
MKKILFVFAMLLLISCNGKTVYSESGDVPENRWQKADIKTYEFEIDQAATQYEIEVLMSYVYGSQVRPLPLIAEITYPDGQMRSSEFSLEFKNAGEDLGDCSGDFCDIAQKIPTQETLVPGKYKLRLMHNSNEPFVANVLNLGIRVSQLND